tara:strand:- start:3411 stop:4115 length:705 start_codon:yes stop_codon:yes gene_type:complete
MKYLREAIRKIKYNLRFISKNKKTKLNYVVNSSTNSKLTELMNLYGSDKGGKNNHHNYSELYSEIFFHKRKEVKNILEIGIGTNNTNIASNMGKEGVPLASLRAWRDYFKNAKIYGADIDKDILKNEERIKTFYVDQTNPIIISNMYKEIGEDKFDIIIDDGLHEFGANICFFENSIGNLSQNGTYIIEDVFYKDKIKFLNYFENLSYNFSIVDIYHKKNIANNCLIIIKKNNE